MIMITIMKATVNMVHLFTLCTGTTRRCHRTQAGIDVDIEGLRAQVNASMPTSQILVLVM